MSINANVPFMGPTGGASDSKSIEILKKKERVLDHVLYEMYMFLWTTKNLKELLKTRIDWENSSQYNAYYIAQKCTLRNILEFFSSNHPIASDIFFCKFYKISKTDEKSIGGSDNLNGYLLFSEKCFDKYFDKVYEIKYYGKGATIKDIVNKTVSHLTDERFDWGSENFEQIINRKEINTKVIQDVKNAIQEFLKALKLYNDNENLYYVYYGEDGKRKFKNLSDELQEEGIKSLLADINSLIKD